MIVKGLTAQSKWSVRQWRQRPGPQPSCSDSELIALALIGDCRGIDKETDLLGWGREPPLRALFLQIPSRTRFNRQRRALAGAINHVRQIVLRTLDLAEDNQCVIDSLPIPVMGFHLVPGGSREWATHEARFGRCASKKQTLYGYKLHCVMTLGRLILDFSLAPANETDLLVGAGLLFGLRERLVVGDKGYISASLAEELRGQGVRVVTLPRRNQAAQVAPAVRRLVNGVRHSAEIVNGQLVEQFHIQTNHAYSFAGLCAAVHQVGGAHLVYQDQPPARPVRGIADQSVGLVDLAHRPMKMFTFQ